MIDRKIDCLPVVDGGKLVGLLTETDFVKLVLAE
jgi:CBS domain-containing protein